MILDYINKTQQQVEAEERARPTKVWKYFGTGTDGKQNFVWRTSSKSNFYKFKAGKSWYGRMLTSNTTLKTPPAKRFSQAKMSGKAKMLKNLTDMNYRLQRRR